MTKLQLLADILVSLSNRIEEVDRQQSNDDIECGVIEGKLAAYKEVASELAALIQSEI